MEKYPFLPKEDSEAILSHEVPYLSTIGALMESAIVYGKCMKYSFIYPIYIFILFSNFLYGHYGNKFFLLRYVESNFMGLNNLTHCKIMFMN